MLNRIVIETEALLITQEEIRDKLRETIDPGDPDELESRVQDCIEFIQKYRTVLLDVVVSLYIETRRIEKAARNIILYFDREKRRKSKHDKPDLISEDLVFQRGRYKTDSLSEVAFSDPEYLISLSYAKYLRNADREKLCKFIEAHPGFFR